MYRIDYGIMVYKFKLLMALSMLAELKKNYFILFYFHDQQDDVIIPPFHKSSFYFLSIKKIIKFLLDEGKIFSEIVK